MASHFEHRMSLTRPVLHPQPCPSLRASPWQLPTSTSRLLPPKNSRRKSARAYVPPLHTRAKQMTAWSLRFPRNFSLKKSKCTLNPAEMTFNLWLEFYWNRFINTARPSWACRKHARPLGRWPTSPLFQPLKQKTESHHRPPGWHPEQVDGRDPDGTRQLWSSVPKKTAFFSSNPTCHSLQAGDLSLWLTDIQYSFTSACA